MAVIDATGGRPTVDTDKQTNDAIQLVEDADKPVQNPDVGECQKPKGWPQYTVTCSKFGEVLVVARCQACQGPRPSDVYRDASLLLCRSPSPTLSPRTPTVP
jgi:hypothetical protein